jgi:cysteinyl-tRNA synthetase
MYVCGPTVYNYISIGNARPIVVFNMVKNYLRFLGYAVKMVQNITDIEDKIINKAREEDVSFDVITKRYIDAFLEDIKDLKIGPIDFMPLATEMIPQIIEIITLIIEKGYAYEIDGNVYFDVSKYPEYGKLSGQKTEEMLKAASSEFEKKNKIDFALWKKAKPGEPFWDSPWGKGRPGWHIECSAMSSELLGFGFDIHGGGIDLIFPHHENEIAQSEAAFEGKGDFVKYWMHNGMIEVREQKMSKSAGLKDNWVLKNLLKNHSANTIKMYILSTHYRSPLEFSESKIEDARKNIERIENTLRNIQFLCSKHYPSSDSRERSCAFLKKIESNMENKFKSAMDDDFNSAKAIGYLFEDLKELNSHIQSSGFASSDQSNKVLALIYEKFIRIFRILSLDFESISSPDSSKEEGGLSDKDIEDLIAKRNAARENKDFAKSDEIRDKLQEMNVVLEDRKEGTVWRRKEK